MSNREGTGSGKRTSKKAAAKRTTKRSAGKDHLRVAGEDEKPPKKPMSLEDAVESGSYLDILVAQRLQMVKDLKGAPAPAKASLHRQILLANKEIAQLKEIESKHAKEDSEVADDEPFDGEAL